MKILIVDDDAMMREILEAFLTPEGYTLTSVQSGEEALDIVKSSPPDLIVLDARLSGVDGFEVCKQIKTNDATRRILVTMATALSSDEDKKRGIEAGVDDFIPKPFDLPVMLNRIRTLLRCKKLYDSLEGVLHKHLDNATTATILEELDQALA